MAMTRNSKRLDPTWAPYVISGRGIAEGHNNEGTARFAFARRSRGFPAGPNHPSGNDRQTGSAMTGSTGIGSRIARFEGFALCRAGRGRTRGK